MSLEGFLIIYHHGNVLDSKTSSRTIIFGTLISRQLQEKNDLDDKIAE